MSVGSLMGPAVHQVNKQQDGDVISTKVLSKAMDAEVEAAAALISALPAPAQPVAADKLPEHIGNNINEVA